jgi:hypothetical protein
MRCAHSIDVLALKFGEKGGETIIISLNSNRAEDRLDVLGRRRRVAAKLEEEICRKVLHFDGDSMPMLVSQAGSMSWGSGQGSFQHTFEVLVGRTRDSITLTAN